MILSIDPGVEMGVALWSSAKWRKLESPRDTEVFLPRVSGDWTLKMLRTMDQFHDWTWQKEKNDSFDGVYIEWPQFYDTASGHVTAKDGLVKLSCAVGMIMDFCHYSLDVPPHKIHLIAPQAWKGQLPKQVVNQRIRKILGAEACFGFRTHAWDAVGLGLWAKGFFK